MRKRVFCFALCAMLLALSASVDAQQTGKIFRIGFLDGGTAAGRAVLVKAFLHELSKLGWIEGKNFTIEYRFAEGKPGRRSELAAELVRLKVDLIVVTGTAAGLDAKKATDTIPIVMTNAADPVGDGIVVNLARRGGNVTGFSALSTDLNTKRLEVLKDAIPKLARVGVLSVTLAGSSMALQLKELRAAAAAKKRSPYWHKRSCPRLFSGETFGKGSSMAKMNARMIRGKMALKLPQSSTAGTCFP